MSDPDYSLFTSLRYDPELILTSWNNKSPLLLENYHVQRLQVASKKFGWEATVNLTGSEDFASKFRAICKDAVRQFTGEEQVVLVRSLDNH
jgi:4-amino-4-deoxychorismate lyase